MAKYCDLHVHSVFSDGTWTPSQIIRKAGSLGLSSVALCDHNTVDGLPDFIGAAEGMDIEAVCGCEFSVSYGKKELHLLGLFIRPEYFGKIAGLMDESARLKNQSNADLIASLNRAGYSLDYEKIKAKTPKGSVNRAHIARELTELGYTASVSEAFDTLLHPDKGHYTEPKRLTVWEMLEFICSIGAVPVLAHPFLELCEGELREFLIKAVPLGLKGIEAEYPLFDTEQRAVLRGIAKEFGILPSGGTDFHGGVKPDIHIGIGAGDLKVPAEWMNELKKYASIL